MDGRTDGSMNLIASDWKSERKEVIERWHHLDETFWSLCMYSEFGILRRDD